MWTIYKLWKTNEHTILKLWTLIKNIIESTHKFPYNILFTFLMDCGHAPNGIGHLMILVCQLSLLFELRAPCSYGKHSYPAAFSVNANLDTGCCASVNVVTIITTLHWASQRHDILQDAQRRVVIIVTSGKAAIIGTVNYSQKHGSRAGEASKTTGSGYRSALAAGCSLLTALYIWT